MALGEGSPAEHSAYAALETSMRQRLGRECLYVPSCRIGLYLALRHWCPPGGRVLMSPVNDDVIFFVVLAAGLRPVQAPLNPYDGSIDVDSVEEGVWSGLSGVITTNLYGNPDPVAQLRLRCDTLGIPLIEDAAHAIGSTVAGRPVGSFGDAAVFSLSKHVGAKTGGFLAVAEPGVRDELAAARDALLLPTRPGAELAYAVRPYAEAAVRGLRLVRAARTALRLLGQEERAHIRMELRPGELSRALTEAPDLAAFHSWVRVDMHDYRLRPGRTRLRRTERLLAGLDRTLAAHRAGTEELLASPWAAPDAAVGADATVSTDAVVGEGVNAARTVQPLFRVPLLVEDRDAAVAALARHRLTTGYLYDPPLDDWAGPDFTDPSPAPAPAAWFARHALPVDPRRAGQVLSVLREAGARPAEVGADADADVDVDVAPEELGSGG
ncbi:DegT/DnrJ/EryC1/StrS family aminotransferase [Streptomyces sp. NBC_01429]|uniref:DegT/DnrJ/EryC1/StrS family aminotransferase n=1 Tax=Streptomyces sp. NBC_01429 TaxID=2903862 RepID=UPI002E2E72FF|nr:DegT/DnrJ/EryC1/StrS family aminotransferase [Streptomyces sp. NBC_01429]